MPVGLIGRERERSAGRARIDATATGSGGLVLIVGEPGIGKSTLLGDLCAYAAETGRVVLRGRAVEGGGAYRAIAEALLGPLRRGELVESGSLHPFRGALSRLLPGWTSGPAPEADIDPSLVLGEGVLRLLIASAPQGCVVALEDLHWADSDTLALLGYLTEAAYEHGVLLLGTAREAPRSAALEQLRGLPGTTSLLVGPLAETEIDELVGASGLALRPEQRDLVRRRSEGIPLLVAELLSAYRSGAWMSAPDWVPEGLSAIVEQRLNGLGSVARALLATASVLPDRPDWDLVARVSGLEPLAAADALRSAVRAELLRIEDGELQWRHVLTRDAVRSTLLPPARRGLSARAAEVLLEVEGPSPSVADLLADAGQSARADELRLDLADQDISRGALRSAEALLDRVAATPPESRGAVTRAHLARTQVDLFTLAGRPAEALALGAGALDVTAGTDHAELAVRLARAAIAAREWAQADLLLDRAGRPDSPLTLVLAADSAHGAGRITEAGRLAARAVELAAALPAVLCEALCVQGRILRTSEPGAARTAFARAAQLAAEHGLRPWRVEALHGVGTIDTLEDEDATLLVTAQAEAVDLGLLGRAAATELLLGDHGFVTDGPLGAAGPAARLAAAGRLLRLPYLEAAARWLLAMADVFTADPEQRATPPAAPPVGSAPPEFMLQLGTVRALAAIAAHDLSAALAAVDRPAEDLLGYASGAPLFDFGLWALLRTALDRGGAEARAGLANAPPGLRRVNQGALAYAQAIAAGRAGDAAAAAAHYANGDLLLGPAPWWQRLLRLLTLECAIADGWGDPVPPLRADLALFERRREVQLARYSRDLLRRAGAETRRGRGDAVVPPDLRSRGITSRELDVLRLVAAGDSNAEIARRLFLSPRTIETHVGNLLAKSGTDNRSALRDWYARLTP